MSSGSPYMVISSPQPWLWVQNHPMFKPLCLWATQKIALKGGGAIRVQRSVSYESVVWYRESEQKHWAGNESFPKPFPERWILPLFSEELQTVVLTILPLSVAARRHCVCSNTLFLYTHTHTQCTNPITVWLSGEHQCNGGSHFFLLVLSVLIR